MRQKLGAIWKSEQIHETHIKHALEIPFERSERQGIPRRINVDSLPSEQSVSLGSKPVTGMRSWQGQRATNANAIPTLQGYASFLNLDPGQLVNTSPRAGHDRRAVPALR